MIPKKGKEVQNNKWRYSDTRMFFWDCNSDLCLVLRKYLEQGGGVWFLGKIWIESITVSILSLLYDTKLYRYFILRKADNKRDSWIVSDILPSLKLTWHSPWKWMVGRRSFPIGVPAYFQGLCRLCSFQGVFFLMRCGSWPMVVRFWMFGQIIMHQNFTLPGTNISFSQGTFESMIFRTSPGGICDRSLEGSEFHGTMPIFANEWTSFAEAGKVEKAVAFWGRVLTIKVERVWFEKCYYEMFEWCIVNKLNLIDFCQKQDSISMILLEICLLNMDILDEIWPFAEFHCMYRKKNQNLKNRTTRSQRKKEAKRVPCLLRVSCVKSASRGFGGFSLFSFETEVAMVLLWSNLQVGDPTSKLVIQPPSWWDQIIHPSELPHGRFDVFFCFFCCFFPRVLLKSFESQWW